jgi:photosystem II stability/assembly factor-like uncharacterized protein
MRFAILLLVPILVWTVSCSGGGDKAGSSPEGPGGSPTSTPSPAVTAIPSPTATPTPASAPATTTAPTEVPGPTPTLIPLPSSAEISAPSGNTIWVLMAGKALFFSDDKGQTWQSRGPSPGHVTFVDDHEGWSMISGSAATQCQAERPQIMHTTDGGVHWVEITTSGIADAGCKNDLSFTDSDNGYFVASSPNAAPVVYHSSDGGKTWTASKPLADPPGVQQSPGGFTLGPDRVQAFDGHLLLAAGLGPNWYVYGSDDGGATWTYQATAPDVEGGLAFVSGSRWLMIGPPQNSFETTDSGATWQPFTTDYSQAAPIPPVITFGDASTGYATVRGEIQRTDDGGTHWSKIESPGTQ